MPSHLYVATRKGLFDWVHQAGEWRIANVHFLGDNVTMFLPVKNGSMFAGLNLGHFGAKLRRLDPGSSEWHECAVPVYPEGAMVNVGPPTGDASPKMKPASLSEIWALESVDENRPGEVWAGTIPGGLFRSTDNGESWQLIESLWDRAERAKWFGGGKDEPGIHSICVDPRNSDYVVLGISCGGVWRTFDGGDSWHNDSEGIRAEYLPPELAYDPVNQDPHLISQCTADPDTMWIQHHNGVFLSRDRGKKWSELKTPQPSCFGFAVAAHPQDRDTSWFVPAIKDECRVPVDDRMVVSRTTDGGESFEVFGAGLPAEHAYDIVFRHALVVDQEGTTLAMGSSTGGLWVSSTAGENWQCLSHTLPQIYCLRFSE